MDIEKIKAEIREIYDAVKKCSDEDILNGPDDELKIHFRKLDEISAMQTTPEQASKLFDDPEFKTPFKEAGRLRRIYGVRLEIEKALAIIDSPQPWKHIESFVFYPNYIKLAEMESGGAELKQGDSIVFLGSGPLPLSLIFLCSRYGLKGLGIEMEPKYVSISQRLLDKLELSDTIEIREGCHFSFPLEKEFDLYMVAAAARPKDEVFKHLSASLPRPAKVSYRIYEKGLRRFLFDENIYTPPPEFEEYLRIRPKPPVQNTCIFCRLA